MTTCATTERRVFSYRFLILPALLSLAACQWGTTTVKFDGSICGEQVRVEVESGKEVAGLDGTCSVNPKTGERRAAVSIKDVKAFEGQALAAEVGKNVKEGVVEGLGAALGSAARTAATGVPK